MLGIERQLFCNLPPGDNAAVAAAAAEDSSYH